MGMGRYQWYIWSLCGLGYFLDLLWAQAFGLIASPLQQELGFSDRQLGNIFTAFSAGLTAGALVWGVLVDIIGLSSFQYGKHESDANFDRAKMGFQRDCLDHLCFWLVPWGSQYVWAYTCSHGAQWLRYWRQYTHRHYYLLGISSTGVYIYLARNHVLTVIESTILAFSFINVSAHRRRRLLWYSICVHTLQFMPIGPQILQHRH